MVYDVTATGVLWATLTFTWGLCIYQVRSNDTCCAESRAPHPADRQLKSQLCSGASWQTNLRVEREG